MKRYVLLGLVVFVVVAITFIPAGVVDRALDQTPYVDMVEARGTVWRGSGQLLALDGTRIGTATWDFEPASLLGLLPRYRWRLDQAQAQLDGTAASRGSVLHLTGAGDIGAGLLNDWLRIYDITLSGDFTVQVESLEWALAEQLLVAASGELTWSGGTVTYVMGGQIRQATLPPMIAVLQTQTADGSTATNEAQTGAPGPATVQVTAFAVGNETPLMIASQSDGGFVKIGITKGFTKLLQNPWPGSDPDHTIVLEVEERLL